MAVPYVSTGRTRQKARTRDALVTATRELMAKGATPTMEGAAEAAGVSRTTAYRYFPSWRSLLAAAYPHIERDSLLGEHPPDDPLARLKLVVDDQLERILKYEPEMRTRLRLSLEPGEDPVALPMNRGLRIGWLEDALSPARGHLGDDALRRLVLGIGATLGIEAFVWLTDIAAATREEAAALMRANALALGRAALASDR